MVYVLRWDRCSAEWRERSGECMPPWYMSTCVLSICILKVTSQIRFAKNFSASQMNIYWPRKGQSILGQPLNVSRTGAIEKGLLVHSTELSGAIAKFPIGQWELMNERNPGDWHSATRHRRFHIYVSSRQLFLPRRCSIVAFNIDRISNRLEVAWPFGWHSKTCLYVKEKPDGLPGMNVALVQRIMAWQRLLWKSSDMGFVDSARINIWN